MMVARAAARVVSRDPATWVLVACMVVLIGLLGLISHQHEHMGMQVGEVQKAVEQLKSSQAIIKVENKESKADRSQINQQTKQLKQETRQLKQVVEHLEAEVQK